MNSAQHKSMYSRISIKIRVPLAKSNAADTKQNEWIRITIEPKFAFTV